MLGCGAPPESADLVVTNARVIDGRGVVHDSAVIAITGKRIQSITSGQKQFNARETIDAQGKTVLPGLINTHVHLRPAGLVDEETLTEYLRNDFLVDLQDYLEHGITTLKSAGDPAEIFIQVRERLARGEIRGPRLFLAGPPLTAVGGHPAATLFADNSWLRTRHVQELSSEAEARAAVRQLAEAGVDAIKFVYQGSTDESKPYLFRPGVLLRKMTPQMMEAIIDEGHQHQLPVTAHTNDLEDALAVLEAGCDGLEHGVTRMRL
ncbi:MAG: amidohydrolase family protein, partial [Acidobacteria bacterium]|nr:amidohydrolase family protein [Acidobacteriota bacterium]